MVETGTPILENPRAPAAILAIGDVAWRIIAWVANFDFILSMREERLAMIFEFLLKWGWAIILVYALLQLWKRPVPPTARKIHWEMVTYVAILAFMGGVLLATWAAGGVPQVVVGWGAGLDGCNGAVNTSRLVGYSGRYKVALACVLQDPTVDPCEDDRIATSNLFTITGATIPVLIPYQGTKLSGVPKLGQQTQVMAFLFPKDEDVKAVKRFSDVKKYGGIPLGLCE